MEDIYRLCYDIAEHPGYKGLVDHLRQDIIERWLAEQNTEAREVLWQKAQLLEEIDSNIRYLATKADI